MKIFRLLSILLTVAVVGGQAHAKGQELSKQELGSWAEVRSLCQAPESFGLQNPPSQIEVACSAEKTFWRVIGQDTYEYPSTQMMMVQLQSDKADMGVLEDQVQLAPTSIACPRVVQQAKTYAVTIGSSCDEIMAFERDHVAFCQEKLKDNTEELESFLVGEKTLAESEHSLCSGLVPEGVGPVKARPVANNAGDFN